LHVAFSGHAYVAGGSTTSAKVYKTRTSKVFSSWSAMTSPGSFQVNGIATLDGTVVFLVGTSGNVYKHDGSTWTQLMSSITTNALYSLSMTSNNDVFLYGANNFVAKTKNGGTTWTTLSSVFESGSTSVTATTRPPHAISMLSSSVVMVGSKTGAIRQTITSGSRWKNATTIATGKTIYCLFLYSSNVGLAGKFVLLVYVCLYH
jgi:photosystem II stability/assembly factor-like uncharacterized protein